MRYSNLLTVKSSSTLLLFLRKEEAVMTRSQSACRPRNCRIPIPSSEAMLAGETNLQQLLMSASHQLYRPGVAEDSHHPVQHTAGPPGQVGRGLLAGLAQHQEVRGEGVRLHLL